MGMIAAPTVVRTPQKGRYHSPKQMNTSSKEEENITDPRFSSNTTKKYRTKTSKGSVIHSNFKINQNSLQKVSMKKYVNYKREIFLSVMRQNDIDKNINEMKNFKKINPCPIAA